jgi:GT2 family glycosyltransferase
MQNTSNRLVSVIIVTCGNDTYTLQCLDSLSGQTYSTLEVVVISNHRDERFLSAIRAPYPHAAIFWGKHSSGYCSALNSGISLSRGEFILCLNDDVILDKRFIEHAIKGFLIDERVGMVTGKVLRWDRKTLDSTGLFRTLWRSAKERGYGAPDSGRYDQEEYVFGVTGAVAFYRRAMLEDIKLGDEYFDTDYHIFYEDLDVAWRAQQCGWRGVLYPLGTCLP